MPEQPKVIRKRIKSVSSTKKITRTMEMVATAKLKSAQQRVQSSGPYLESLRQLMGEIGGSGVDVSKWPQFEVRPGKRTDRPVPASRRPASPWPRSVPHPARQFLVDASLPPL